jgi:hypothetical protein
MSIYSFFLSGWDTYARRKQRATGCLCCIRIEQPALGEVSEEPLGPDLGLLPETLPDVAIVVVHAYPCDKFEREIYQPEYPLCQLERRFRVLEYPTQHPNSEGGEGSSAIHCKWNMVLLPIFEGRSMKLDWKSL